MDFADCGVHFFSNAIKVGPLKTAIRWGIADRGRICFILLWRAAATARLPAQAFRLIANSAAAKHAQVAHGVPRQGQRHCIADILCYRLRSRIASKAEKGDKNSHIIAIGSAK